MKKLLFPVFLALLLLIAAAAQSQGLAARTVMIYMVGSDLEDRYAAASRDVQEMARSGADLSQINVVFALGGADHWTIVPLEDGKMRIGALNGLNSVTWLDEPTARDMAAPETLTYFIDTAVQAYPAQQYDLILWDHGAGLYGFGLDSVSAQIMSVPQLAKALENSCIDRFELLGFDACLMGTLEVAVTLAPYTEYFVASEETIPSGGFDYGFLGRPSACEAEPDAMLRDLCGMYAASVKPDVPYSLAVLRTERLTKVCEAFDLMINDALRQPAQGDAYLIRSAEQSTVFSKWTSSRTMDLFDLRSFAVHAADGSAYTANLQDAIDQAVLINVSNIEDASGISFFCPSESVQEDRRYFFDFYGQLEENGVLSTYSRWLRNLSYAEQTGPAVKRRQSAVKGEHGTIFSMALSEEEQAQYVKGYYLIMIEVDTPNGPCWRFYELCRDVHLQDGMLTAERARKIYAFTDGSNDDAYQITLIERNRNGSDVQYWFNGLLFREDPVLIYDIIEMNGQFLVNEEYPDGSIRELVPRTDADTVLAPRELLTLQEGDEFHVTWVDMERAENDAIPFNQLARRSDGMIYGARFIIGPEATLTSRYVEPDPTVTYYVQLNATLVDGTLIASEPMPFVDRPNGLQ